MTNQDKSAMNLGWWKNDQAFKNAIFSAMAPSFGKTRAFESTEKQLGAQPAGCVVATYPVNGGNMLLCWIDDWILFFFLQ